MKLIYQDESIDEDAFIKIFELIQFPEHVKMNLNKPFTEKEIEKALLLTPNKSPGPSGMSVTFFKTFKNQVVPILTKIANTALLEGKIDEFLLRGLITLIPKKENSNKKSNQKLMEN